MVARLEGDATLTGTNLNAGQLGFGVYDHWLVQTGPGATPQAFDAARGNRLKRSIVVLGAGRVPRPGVQPGSDAHRWNRYPRLFFFAEAHANGKRAIEEAKLRVEDLLIGWEAVVERGQRVSFRPADETEPAESDFPGSIQAIARWEATGVRQYAA